MQSNGSTFSEPWWQSQVFTETKEDIESPCKTLNKAGRENNVHGHASKGSLRPVDARQTSRPQEQARSTPDLRETTRDSASRHHSRRASRHAEAAAANKVLVFQADYIVSAYYNPVRTQAFLADGVRTLGDIDHCIYSSRDGPSFFLMYARNEEEKTSNMILRLLVDADVYEPPLVTHVGLKDLPKYYYKRLPTRGLLYAFMNGKMVNVSFAQLNSALIDICRRNCRVKQLKVRYKSHLQPLIEYQQAKKNEKVFEKMQIIFFGRCSAYTRECLMSLLLATSFDMFSGCKYSKAYDHLRLFLTNKLVYLNKGYGRQAAKIGKI